jgi:hypothetical protein
MNSNLLRGNLLRGLNTSLLTTVIMRYTLPLAIVQILCVILFFAWMVSL